MKKNTTILFILFIIVLPFTAWAIVNWYQQELGSLPVIAESRDHRIGDFTLTDQDGKLVSSGRMTDRVVVANFFFSHCPSICPQMTRNIISVQQAFPGTGGIQILSFTVDPERDEPPVLKKFAERYHINLANWSLLTGDKRSIYKLARNSFMVVATDGDGGPDDFIHSEKLVLIDQERRIRGYYDGTSTTETKKLIADIKKLLK